MLAAATAAATVLSVTGGTAASAQSRPAERGPGEHLLVGFRDRPGPAELALLRAHGAQVRHEFPAEAAVAVTLAGGGVAAVARDARVLYVEPDPQRHPSGLGTSELTPTSSNGLYGLLSVRATTVHQAGLTGSGVTSCVGDTSLDRDHPDIVDRYKGGIDTVGGVRVLDPDVADGETHGTHVAGTLLATRNTVGVYGVAPAADLKFARVLGPDGGTSSDIMAGVQWLHDAGCNLVNLSLGGGTASRTEKNFYARMRNEGLLVVAAAGNDSARKISYPAAYEENIAVGAVTMNNAHASFSNTGRGLDVAAPGVGVLSSVREDLGSEASVAASAQHGAHGLEYAGRTGETGVGATLVACGLGTASDVQTCAPAGKVALIQRGEISFGDKVTNAMNGGALAAVIYNNAAGNFVGTLGSATTADGRAWIPAVSVSDTAGTALAGDVGSTVTVVNMVSDWDSYDGTSMATPHASGVLTLILQRENLVSKSKANADRAEAILESTARDLGAAGYDTTFGYGLVQAAP